MTESAVCAALIIVMIMNPECSNYSQTYNIDN